MKQRSIDCTARAAIWQIRSSDHGGRIVGATVPVAAVPRADAWGAVAAVPVTGGRIAGARGVRAHRGVCISLGLNCVRLFLYPVERIQGKVMGLL